LEKDEGSTAASVSAAMSAETVETLFTRADGSYAFARWGRPIVPVVFGVQEATLEVIKGALEAVNLVAGHKMAEVDPELGVNFMMFFFSEWDELLDVQDLDRLVPDLGPLVAKLKDADANQYRVFRFDEAGGIKAAFVFLRMDQHLQAVPAETLALSQVVQSMVLWSDTAFRETSPLAVVQDTVILRPDISAILRAAYDPVMPLVASDPSHALRVFARVGDLQ